MFFVGVCLIGLNIFGLFKSLRNPAIYQLDAAFDDNITLTQQQFDAIIADRSGAPADYATRVTMAVNQAIVHYWEEQGTQSYNVKPPAHENYLLYALTSFWNDPRYEFCSYQKAVERGVGLCSQQVAIVVSVLSANEIPAKIISFPWLHVVATAQVAQDTWWVLDPDYGVVIPFDIQAISQNPEIARACYVQAGYDRSTLDSLEEIYATPYELYDSLEAYFPEGYCFTERASYWAIWLFPMLFMTAGLLPVCSGCRAKLRFQQGRRWKAT